MVVGAIGGVVVARVVVVGPPLLGNADVVGSAAVIAGEVLGVVSSGVAAVGPGSPQPPPTSNAAAITDHPRDVMGVGRSLCFEWFPIEPERRTKHVQPPRSAWLIREPAQ